MIGDTLAKKFGFDVYMCNSGHGDALLLLLCSFGFLETLCQTD